MYCVVVYFDMSVNGKCTGKFLQGYYPFFYSEYTISIWDSFSTEHDLWPQLENRIISLIVILLIVIMWF